MTTLSRREMLRGAAFRDLLPRVRPHAGTIAVASVLLVLSSAIHLAFPLVVGHLLDAAFVDADRVFLDTIALVLLGLFAIQAVMNYGQVYLMSAVGERVTGTLRNDLFSHLLSLPVAFFASRRTGELTSRLTSDVGLLQNLLSHQVAEFFRQGLYLVGAIILLAITSPQLTATTLIAVPIVVGSAFFFGRRLRRSSTEVQDRVADANAVAEEAFSQIRVVQSFTQERSEVGRFAARIRESVDTALERAQYRGVFFGVITFVAFGAVVMVLWQGGRLVLAGELTAGMLVAFLLYAVTVAASVGTLATLWSRYQEASGAALRVFELLETPSEITSPREAVALPRPLQGEIRYSRVSFRYDAHEPPRQQLATEADAEEDGWVLCDIDLHVAAGETVALVGPSGAGKTTLVSLLPRFWDPQRGAITLDGLELGALSLRELREAIGIVPQETPLFSGTIRENIAYGRPTPPRRRSGRRRARPTPRSSSPGSPAATTRGSASAASSSRAGSGSASPSPAPCSRIRRCSSWTRRPATWTRRARASSRRRSTACWWDAPRSSSPTGCPPPGARTGWWCWTGAHRGGGLARVAGCARRPVRAAGCAPVSGCGGVDSRQSTVASVDDSADPDLAPASWATRAD
jgi:ATP-binding cassette, subfamily B, bacterial MsbA